MALPIHTTLISVLRSDQDGTKDSTDTLTWSTIASGVRAHIGSPGGSETVTAGSSSTVTTRLSCDPTDLQHGDRVYDESLGLTYEVSWTAQRRGYGLEHTAADLVIVTDRAAL
jgi:hypothetical protein